MFLRRVPQNLFQPDFRKRLIRLWIERGRLAKRGVYLYTAMHFWIGESASTHLLVKQHNIRTPYLPWTHKNLLQTTKLTWFPHEKRVIPALKHGEKKWDNDLVQVTNHLSTTFCLPVVLTVLWLFSHFQVWSWNSVKQTCEQVLVSVQSVK